MWRRIGSGGASLEPVAGPLAPKSDRQTAIALQVIPLSIDRDLPAGSNIGRTESTSRTCPNTETNFAKVEDKFLSSEDPSPRVKSEYFFMRLNFWYCARSHDDLDCLLSSQTVPPSPAPPPPGNPCGGAFFWGPSALGSQSRMTVREQLAGAGRPRPPVRSANSNIRDPWRGLPGLKPNSRLRSR